MSKLSLLGTKNLSSFFVVFTLAAMVLTSACLKMERPTASSVDGVVRSYHACLLTQDRAGLQRILADDVTVETSEGRMSFNKMAFIDRVLNPPYPLKSIVSHDAIVTDSGDTAQYSATEVQEIDSPNSASHVAKHTYYFVKSGDDWKLTGIRLQPD